MSKSNAVLNEFYSQQNDLARKSYFTQLKYDKDMPLQLKDDKKRPTPLYFRYSPEGIKARHDAISLISVYGNRLLVLAGTDSPQRISDSAGSIVSRYQGLPAAFGGLSGDEAAAKKVYIENTQKLVSAVTKMYYEKQQSDALLSAINEGHSAVDAILKTLQADILSLSATHQARTNSQLSNLVYIYNEDVDARKAKSSQTFSESQRLDLLNQAQNTAALYEGTVINQPDDVVAAMIQANDDLYAFAQNPKGENSLIALNAAIESFNAKIQPFVDYYLASKGDN
ncbi:hypothetical protein [Pseudomonas sp. PLMAX]|uniref:hypothetical protein n=1 Tax=Pseudomonas sp. PLMAX TaxID=2201998 RepID=UPI0038BA4963